MIFDPLLFACAGQPRFLALGLLRGRLASRWFLRHLRETAAEVGVFGRQDNLVTGWKFFVATLDSGLVLCEPFGDLNIVRHAKSNCCELMRLMARGTHESIVTKAPFDLQKFIEHLDSGTLSVAL